MRRLLLLCMITTFLVSKTTSFSLARSVALSRSSFAARNVCSHQVNMSVQANDDTSNASTPPQTASTINQQEEEDAALLFGKFTIPLASVFYRSPVANTAAFCNLRPIVPGHVLVMPQRVVAELKHLTELEYQDLWSTVRVVQRILEQEYKATSAAATSIAFNVAVQDGRAAGQSVPHVHVHILPRVQGDYERNDDIYDELQEWAPRAAVANKKGLTKLQVPNDAERRDRTREEMAQEAATYREIQKKLEDESSS